MSKNNCNSKIEQYRNNIVSDDIDVIESDDIDVYRPPYHPEISSHMIPYVVNTGEYKVSRSPDECIDIIIRLDKNSNIYRNILRNSRAKAAKYENNHIDVEHYDEDNLQQWADEGYIAEYLVWYGSRYHNTDIDMIAECKDVNEIDFVDFNTGITYDLKTTSSLKASNLLVTKENYNGELSDPKDFQRKIKNIDADKFIHSYYKETEDYIYVGVEGVIDSSVLADIAVSDNCSKWDDPFYHPRYSGHRQIYYNRRDMYERDTLGDFIDEEDIKKLE